MSKKTKIESVKSRFDTPFYSNYDTYSTTDGSGPGAGWNSMKDFKSIKDFLKSRRKKLKNKYVYKKSFRIKLLEKLAEYGPDNQTTPINYNSNNITSLIGDEYLLFPDPDGKTVDKLNYRNDLFDPYSGKKSNKYIKTDSPLLGMEDGVSNEDKDADKTKSNNSSFGTTDYGNSTYESLLNND